MKKEDSISDSSPIYLSIEEKYQEDFIIYDGIEFKRTPYKFMFEVPFFRCSHSINYFHISSSNWTEFKTGLQELFSTDFLRCAKSFLLFIILPEKIKQGSTTILQQTNEIFSIDKELKKRFGKAFFFTTSFTSGQLCKAHIMLCDNAPTENDFIPEYHRGIGEPWDFLEICHHCPSPCQILHFCIQCPKNEIDKWDSQVHNTINESHLANPSILTIIQLGLPYSGITANERTIIQKSFEIFDPKILNLGIGASITANMIEANIYLIFNPSKDIIPN